MVNGVFIDLKGNIVVPINYDDTDYFSEGLAAVMVNGKWGYVNAKGEIVIEPQYLLAGSFSPRGAIVSKEKNGKILVINKKK